MYSSPIEVTVNNLPQVKFPAFISPPSVNKENIQEEILKMRRIYTTTQDDNEEEQKQDQNGRDKHIIDKEI